MARDSAPHDAPVPGRRISARLRLRIPARLMVLDGNFSCLLDDLSRSGARVSLQQLPTKGSDGILTCSGLDVFCTVVWVRNGQCGLHFAEPLPQEVLLAMRNLLDNYAQHERDRVKGIARDWVTGSNRML